MVTSANDNAMYHLAELDGTWIAVPVAGKQIKVFKKWHEDELDSDCEGEHNDPEGANEDGRVNDWGTMVRRMKSDEQSDFTTFFFRHIPVDVRFGRGGCHGEIRPWGEIKPNT